MFEWQRLSSTNHLTADVPRPGANDHWRVLLRCSVAEEVNKKSAELGFVID